MMGKEGGIGVLQGYEPFGSLLPGRNWDSNKYAFGFQGQEKDDEIYGATGTSYAFEYRMHDARVGRFWSLDPLAAKYPWNSPYAFAENKVIQFIELEGLETARNYGDYEGKKDTDWGIVPSGAWGASEKTDWKGDINGREFEIFKCPNCTGPSGKKDSPLMYQYTLREPPTTDAPNRLPVIPGDLNKRPVGGKVPPPTSNSHRPVLRVERTEGFTQYWPYALDGDQIGTFSDKCNCPVDTKTGEPFIFRDNDPNKDVLDKGGKVLYKAPEGGMSVRGIVPDNGDGPEKKEKQ